MKSSGQRGAQGGGSVVSGFNFLGGEHRVGWEMRGRKDQKLGKQRAWVGLYRAVGKAGSPVWGPYQDVSSWTSPTKVGGVRLSFSGAGDLQKEGKIQTRSGGSKHVKALSGREGGRSGLSAE